MKSGYNLEFLKTKIEKTGTALCTMHLPGLSSNSFIIHTTSVDRDGIIKFRLIDSLPKTTKEDLSSFGLRLFYYKKGLGYYLNIEALATASHNNPEKDNEEPDENWLFVKAKILSAEYRENFQSTDNHTGFLHSLRKKINQVAAGIFWM